MIHAFTTGYVKITEKWLDGDGEGLGRLVNTIFDKQRTDWLPIWCFVIEHEEGLIVIDTGISTNANDPVYFPPYMPLFQRAVSFDISEEQELAYQMRQNGLNPDDVRYVILTHLHQDHDGGIHQFPNAEFLVSRDEWQVATGIMGRINGYLNQRWFDGFKPTLVDFTDGAYGEFPQSYHLFDDVVLVPTAGHSKGMMSIIYQENDAQMMFIGDSAYSESALMQSTVDGVTEDIELALNTMEQLRETAQHQKSVILPSHDPQSAERLQAHYSEASLFLAE